MTFWRAAGVIMRKDLMVEGRSGEVLWITIPFGLIALFLIPLALPLDNPLLQRIAGPMYWVILLLFGMTIALRRSAVGTTPQREALRMLGIDPAARFTGRVLATTLLSLAFALVLAPATVVLFDANLPTSWPLLLPIVMAVTLGLGIVGTVAAELTRGLRTRTALAPLLVAPLAAPLLVAAAQATESLSRGDSILLPALIIAFTVLGLAVIGVLTAGPLEETQ